MEEPFQMTAATRISFYFDPISPYVWLANAQLARIESPAVDIVFQPVLFAGLLNAHGQKGPAEIAAKRLYTFRDVMREAARLGLPFRGPPGHPFNSLLALRTCRAIDGQPERRRFAAALLGACWERGADLADMATLESLANGCGLDGAALLQAALAPANKQGLADDTAAAVNAGIFGVPTFSLDNELFWGGDRIDALHAYLSGQRIDDANLQRFLALPPAAQRKAALP
jgi:2-hydroxychromene-2-carboxylate isomerase